MNEEAANKTRLPAWIYPLCLAHGLPRTYAVALREHLMALARRIVALRARTDRPLVIGINGAQGSGKTTLALFLQQWLEREAGLRCACLSLDDVYLGSQERQVLARKVHPLLATRGVPGTHDVALAHELLDTLTDTSCNRTVSLPAFDKALDDRAPAEEWRAVEAPVDVVLFEGWCVGARPQKANRLTEPVNELETVEDADKTWRRYVNWRLETDYADLFSRLDGLVMLRIPGFDKVFEWRRLQEEELRKRLAADTDDARADRTQTDEELKGFIMHYERLTRHMLDTLPAQADAVIEIDEEHRMVRLIDNTACHLPGSGKL